MCQLLACLIYLLTCHGTALGFSYDDWCLWSGIDETCILHYLHNVLPSKHTHAVTLMKLISDNFFLKSAEMQS